MEGRCEGQRKISVERGREERRFGNIKIVVGDYFKRRQTYRKSKGPSTLKIYIFGYLNRKLEFKKLKNKKLKTKSAKIFLILKYFQYFMIRIYIIFHFSRIFDE